MDAIKFQAHIAEAESSEFEPFRVKFSNQDSTRYEYWQRMEFSLDQLRGLREKCREKGLKFISSPFSIAAMDLLDQLDIDTCKIGSGEVRNLLLLDRISRTGKPIILSSGMSSWNELDQTIDFLRKFDNHLSILQCITAYPTSPDQWGLNVISHIKDRYSCPVGFSDHSGNIFACLASATLAAELFEFHVVFDKRQFGPDSVASIEIDQVKELCKGIKEIQFALQNPIQKVEVAQYENLKMMFGKSLAVNKDLPKNHKIRMEDLETKKPGGMGIPADEYQNVLGKTISKELIKWDFLKEDYLQE